MALARSRRVRHAGMGDHFNNRRLPEPIGTVLLAGAEPAYYASLVEPGALTA